MNRRLPLIAVVFASLLVSPASLPGQRRSGGGRSMGTGMRSSGLPPEQVRAAVVEFQGMLRNYDKKQVILETGDGQTLVLRRTKGTEFLGKDGNKPLVSGIAVQVEAKKDGAGDLTAVRICEGSCKPAQN